MKPALCTIFMKVAIKHHYQHNNDLHATFHPNIQCVFRIQYKQLRKQSRNQVFVLTFYPAALLKYILIKYRVKKKHPSAKYTKFCF